MLSAEPLRDNQLFEVKIDRKVKYAFMYGVWSNALAITGIILDVW